MPLRAGYLGLKAMRVERQVLFWLSAALVLILLIAGFAMTTDHWFSTQTLMAIASQIPPTVRANPSCRVRALTPTRAARQAVDHGRSGCSWRSSRACRTARGCRGVAPAASASL